VLQKLKRHFYLVNLHFNNWSCTHRAAPLPAWAYQVQWVNKRIGVPDPAAPFPAPMSPLNAPDSPTWSDCQLRTPTRRRMRQRWNALSPWLAVTLAKAAQRFAEKQH
jgi:hypothetical protein